MLILFQTYTFWCLKLKGGVLSGFILDEGSRMSNISKTVQLTPSTSDLNVQRVALVLGISFYAGLT